MCVCVCESVSMYISYQPLTTTTSHPKQDAPTTPEECFTWVKAIFNPLLRRSRGGQRVRCVRSLQEARKCVENACVLCLWWGGCVALCKGRKGWQWHDVTWQHQQHPQNEKIDTTIFVHVPILPL